MPGTALVRPAELEIASGVSTWKSLRGGSSSPPGTSSWNRAVVLMESCGRRRADTGRRSWGLHSRRLVASLPKSLPVAVDRGESRLLIRAPTGLLAPLMWTCSPEQARSDCVGWQPRGLLAGRGHGATLCGKGPVELLSLLRTARAGAFPQAHEEEESRSRQPDHRAPTRAPGRLRPWDSRQRSSDEDHRHDSALPRDRCPSPAVPARGEPNAPTSI